MKSLLTLWIFLVTIISAFAQTGSTSSPQPCYMKMIYLDSASGKPAAMEYDLTKPFPTLQIKDSYACKCEIKEVDVVLVRGKRPVANWKLDISYINLATLLSNTAQPGDRLMISVIKGVADATTCFFISNEVHPYYATLK